MAGGLDAGEGVMGGVVERVDAVDGFGWRFTYSISDPLVGLVRAVRGRL